MEIKKIKAFFRLSCRTNKIVFYYIFCAEKITNNNKIDKGTLFMVLAYYIRYVISTRYHPTLRCSW